MGILEKIKEIEDEMARTQKNKATNYHMGLLRGKLSRLRTQLMDGNDKGKTANTGETGFDVMKSEDARVALIGFPSVGKSTLLSKLTSTKSLSAAYEFTTLTCIPGVLRYKDANIQLLDLPGIIEQASAGKGRGRQVIGVARTADLILMLVDAKEGFKQKKLLTKELETSGIRLNKKRPNVWFKRKKTGGVLISKTVTLTKLDDRLIKLLLGDYKVFNAELVIREDISVDQLIDVIEGNRMYIPCIYAFNKIDNITIEKVDMISREDNSIVLSANKDLNLKRVVQKIWDYLELVRVYTKPKGRSPDLKEPLILRKGATIEYGLK